MPTCPKCRMYFAVPDGEECDHECPRCGFAPWHDIEEEEIEEEENEWGEMWEGYKITKVYDYYDMPILFTCVNEENKLFLALWVEETSTYDRWLLVQLSNERLNDLEQQKVSLYNAFKQPEEGYLLYDGIDTGWDRIYLSQCSPCEITDEDLPERHVVLSV